MTRVGVEEGAGAGAAEGEEELKISARDGAVDAVTRNNGEVQQYNQRL